MTVKVSGLRELGERMRSLSKEVAGKAAFSGVLAGATVIKKAAIRKVEANPSIETGSLHDAIITKRVPRGQLKMTAEYIVTVRRGLTRRQKAKGKQRAAPHASFVEFGTVNMPAEPFMRPAFDGHKEEAVQAIVAKLDKAITKAAGR